MSNFLAVFSGTSSAPQMRFHAIFCFLILRRQLSWPVRTLVQSAVFNTEFAS